jgi:death-on-curing protein
MSFRWIDSRALVLLHDESLAIHGGASGIRDRGLLERLNGWHLSIDRRSRPA